MGVKQGVQRGVKSLAGKLGYEVHRSQGAPTMAAALHRMAAHTPVGTVIDVGASDSRWSAMAMEAYPHAQFLLVEAQAGPHETALRDFERSHRAVQVVMAAAGDHEGEIHFDGGDPFGGQASSESTGENDVVVPMTTIDAQVARRDLEGPYLLKLDTHGFEVPIFDGATETLRGASLVIVEAYNFTLMPGALRFHELCAYLGERGFRPADVADVMRRPSDGLLWQFDLVFLRADRSEFASATYP